MLLTCIGTHDDDDGFGDTFLRLAERDSVVMKQGSLVWTRKCLCFGLVFGVIQTTSSLNCTWGRFKYYLISYVWGVFGAPMVCLIRRGVKLPDLLYMRQEQGKRSRVHSSKKSNGVTTKFCDYFFPERIRERALALPGGNWNDV